MLWEQGVVGSNPATPTNEKDLSLKDKSFFNLLINYLFSYPIFLRKLYFFLILLPPIFLYEFANSKSNLHLYS